MIDIKDMSYIPSLGEIGKYIGIPLFEAFVNTWMRSIRQSAE